MVGLSGGVAPAQAQAPAKPNILVIMGDDIGYWNISAYNRGLMGCRTPIRTGMLKVGLPGAPEGLSEKDPAIADLLKPQGYVTGQSGKNQLGDRNDFLPTVHGFDEFFGNLHQLNAEEKPENIDHPKDPTGLYDPFGQKRHHAGHQDRPPADRIAEAYRTIASSKRRSPPYGGTMQDVREKRSHCL